MLTVAEEYLLLTAGKPDDPTSIAAVDLPKDRLGIRFAMAGAALMELAIRDRIETDVDQLWICDPNSTGEPSIDPVLARLVALLQGTGARKPIVDTIKQLDTINAYQLALDSLKSKGAVNAKIERVFGLFPIKSSVVIDVAAMDAIRKRIHGILLDQKIPDPREACLISLLDATKKMRRVVPQHRVEEALAQSRRYSSLDLVGRNVALHVTGMINSFARYGDIV